LEKLWQIRFGELMLKGKNRGLFLNKVRESIFIKLKIYNVFIKHFHDQTIVYDENENIEIKNILISIPGIHSVAFAFKVSRDVDQASTLVAEYLNKIEKPSTFKINTKRLDKKYELGSGDFSRSFAQSLLPKLVNHSLDIINPDKMIKIEIYPDYFLIIVNSHEGLGGYPNNSAAKAISLISGGIDSPVATYLSLRKGLNTTLFHFESTPLTPIESLDKVIDLSKKLARFTIKDEIQIVIVPFLEVHKQILEVVTDRLIITIMRRIMYKIAQEYCHKHKIPCIVNGDSLGQVASQTIESMATICDGITIPILRPLLTYDKQEIITISKKIDTFDISIRNFTDCCTVYIPEHPATKPKLKECLLEEKKMNLEELVKNAVEKSFKITITPNTDIKPSQLGLTSDDLRRHLDNI
jgi:thiamine biosynthesis protein ThiI